jgi:hypothetical protein
MFKDIKNVNILKKNFIYRIQKIKLNMIKFFEIFLMLCFIYIKKILFICLINLDNNFEYFFTYSISYLNKLIGLFYRFD